VQLDNGRHFKQLNRCRRSKTRKLSIKLAVLRRSRDAKQTVTALPFAIAIVYTVNIS